MNEHDPICLEPLSLDEREIVIARIEPVYCDLCIAIAKARADEREKAAQKVEQYGKDTHPSHAPNYGCQRCDIHAAYNNAADIVRGKL